LPTPSEIFFSVGTTKAPHNAILEYDAYVDDATERAVKRIADIDTASMELTIGNIDPNQDVVIVGFDMLLAVGRSFLPDEYDTVDLFTDDPSSCRSSVF